MFSSGVNSCLSDLFFLSLGFLLPPHAYSFIPSVQFFLGPLDVSGGKLTLQVDQIPRRIVSWKLLA